MKSLIFLEVEPTDEAQIKATYPNAITEPKVLSEDELIQKYTNAEVLCPFIYTKITKKVIDALPHLKLIVTRSVGYNHIDLKAARERNIPVCNVPDYGAHAIAEHVFALLLSSIRWVKEGDSRVELNYFDFKGLRGISLKGKTLGIIGTGKIGKNVARIASLGFLMDVIASDPYPDEDAARECHFKYVSQDEIWKKSDIITLHAPLLENTKHMVNKNSIKKMKKGVVLVNTARGGLIDTSEMIDGLKKGHIGSVALDVLEHEKNLERHNELLHMPNVTITPHIAFYADDTMKKMYSEAITTIQRFENGEKLPHQVIGV